MTPDDTKSPVSIIGAPQLWELQFDRTDDAPIPSGAEGALAFELGFARIAPTDVGVQLAVTVRDVPGATLKAAFRATFRLEVIGDAGDVETRMKMLGSHIAPAVLYPYLRETLSTLAQRAGLRSVTLPIINFSAFFNLDEIDFPAAAAVEAVGDLVRPNGE